MSKNAPAFSVADGRQRAGGNVPLRDVAPLRCRGLIEEVRKNRKFPQSNPMVEVGDDESGFSDEKQGRRRQPALLFQKIKK